MPLTTATSKSEQNFSTSLGLAKKYEEFRPDLHIGIFLRQSRKQGFLMHRNENIETPEIAAAIVCFLFVGLDLLHILPNNKKSIDTIIYDVIKESKTTTIATISTTDY